MPRGAGGVGVCSNFKHPSIWSSDNKYFCGAGSLFNLVPGHRPGSPSAFLVSLREFRKAFNGLPLESPGVTTCTRWN